MKIVKVTLDDGSCIVTRFNGTWKEIQEYYEIGSCLNTGSRFDRMQEIVKVDLLEEEEALNGDAQRNTQTTPTEQALGGGYQAEDGH